MTPLKHNMKAIDLARVADWAGGDLIQGQPCLTVDTVSSDTRTLQGGELFVALSGERFNGHDFVAQATEKGVAAMLVSELNRATQESDAAIVYVPDVLVGLQLLARNYRLSLEGMRSVGITGSNGKTSTKDLTAAVLRRRYQVQATRGNLNNHIGLPLTLLECEPEHEFAVLEMGMSHPGEIEVLAEIAAPSIGVITQVGTAHIEFMKTRDAIAEEKGMLVEAIDADGCVVIPAEDDYAEALVERARGRVILVGGERGEVRAEKVELSVEGTRFDLCVAGRSVPVTLPVAGRHMVLNALLAAAVGHEAGVELEAIAAGLGEVELTPGRLQLRSVGGLRIIDDSYNANPDSMRAALQVLREAPGTSSGRTIAVLGRMAELGDASEEEHHRLGEAAAALEIDLVIGVGEAGEQIALAAGKTVESLAVADAAAAAAELRERAVEEDWILVKGSRSSRMEAVIEAL